MSWQDDRARLNHYVLANHVANELMALAIAPNGDVSRLCQLAKREKEFIRLFAEAENALSFAKILDHPMFDVWDADFRCKMQEAAHRLFLATSPIPAMILELNQLFRNCLVEATQFLSTPQDQRTTSQVASLRHWVERLQSGISALPKTQGE